MLKRFKVKGNSLYPQLKDGERIVCLKLNRFMTIKLNDIVVFSKAPYGMMIKQVKRIEGYQYFVQGTDPMSIDSRNFGLIELADIKYKKLF